MSIEVSSHWKVDPEVQIEVFGNLFHVLLLEEEGEPSRMGTDCFREPIIDPANHDKDEDSKFSH